jgi:hypothetical protein
MLKYTLVNAINHFKTLIKIIIIKQNDILILLIYEYEFYAFIKASYIIFSQ